MAMSHSNSTRILQFDLACEEWQRSLIGSASTLGMMLALPLTGWVADQRGRRTALALNAFNRAWLGLARSFTHSYTGFIILEFLEAVGGNAGFACGYIIGKGLIHESQSLRIIYLISIEHES